MEQYLGSCRLEPPSYGAVTVAALQLAAAVEETWM
jgi:hypothetical protein